MGGDLQIVARFPEGAATIRNFAGIGEDGGRWGELAGWPAPAGQDPSRLTTLGHCHAARRQLAIKHAHAN